MSVYTPPALNAVDFALTEQPAHSVAPAESVLSVYTVPSLAAVDFALTTYTPPVYNLINFEFLPAGGTTYEDTGTAAGIWAASGLDSPYFIDAGTATGLLVGSGLDSQDNADAGTATGLLVGSGSDNPDFIDAGTANSTLTGSGTDAIDQADAGNATGILVGSGTDEVTSEDAGSGVLGLSASGADEWSLTYEDAGTATTLLIGSGADQLDVEDAGTAAGIWIGSGEDVYTFPPGVPGDIYGARNYSGFGTSSLEAIPGLATEQAKGEATPELLVVKGRKASTPEWRVAMAADRLKVSYQFQVPIDYGRQLKGGQVIDFIFYIAPMPVPCYVQGDYWHGSLEKRQIDQWMMKRVQAAFDYQVTEPIEIWEHEVPTVDAAVMVLRQKLHL